jgi:hypothetical protein
MIDEDADRWTYVVPALLMCALAVAFWAVSEHNTYGVIAGPAPSQAKVTLSSGARRADTTPGEPRGDAKLAAAAAVNAKNKTDMSHVPQSETPRPAP